MTGDLVGREVTDAGIVCDHRHEHVPKHVEAGLLELPVDLVPYAIDVAFADEPVPMQEAEHLFGAGLARPQRRVERDVLGKVVEDSVQLTQLRVIHLPEPYAHAYANIGGLCGLFVELVNESAHVLEVVGAVLQHADQNGLLHGVEDLRVQANGACSRSQAREICLAVHGIRRVGVHPQEPQEPRVAACHDHHTLPLHKHRRALERAARGVH